MAPQRSPQCHYRTINRIMNLVLLVRLGDIYPQYKFTKIIVIGKCNKQTKKMSIRNQWCLTVENVYVNYNDDTRQK